MDGEKVIEHLAGIEDFQVASGPLLAGRPCITCHCPTLTTYAL
jgi:hypothetical protein